MQKGDNVNRIEILLKSLKSNDRQRKGYSHRLTKASITSVFDIIKEIPFFNNILSMNNNVSRTEEKLFKFCSKMKIVERKENEKLFKSKNKEENNVFYIFIVGKIYNHNISFGTELNETFFDSVIETPSFFIEINTNSYKMLILDIEKDKLQTFKNTMNSFELFKDIPKSFLEKNMHKFVERKYSKGEFLYKEDCPISSEKDGIFFIIKGSVIIFKKKIEESQIEKLNKIDKEILSLKKEGSVLLRCMNGKIDSNRIYKKNINPNSIINKKILIMNSVYKANRKIVMLSKFDTVGDIEMIYNMKRHPYSVKVTDELLVYFISYSEFLNIIPDEVYNIILSSVEAKSKMLNTFYRNTEYVSNSVLNADNYTVLKENNGIIINRNNPDCFHSDTINKSVNNVNVNLTLLNRYKLPKLTKKQNSFCESFSRNQLKTVSSMRMSTQETFRKASKIKITKDIEASSYFSERSKGDYINYGGLSFNGNNYLRTGVKSVTMNEKLRRNVIFHFGSLKGNIKSLLASTNPNDIKLSYMK